MPTRIVWTLCALLCLAHPAAAQFKSGSGGEAILKHLSLLPGPFNPPANEAGGATSPILPGDQQSSVLGESGNRPPRLNLFLNAPRQDAGHLAIEPLIGAGQCAHMIIDTARSLDSQMVTVAPKQMLRNTPAVQGVRPCPEDIRPAQVRFTTPGISTPPKP